MLSNKINVYLLLLGASLYHVQPIVAKSVCKQKNSTIQTTIKSILTKYGFSDFEIKTNSIKASKTDADDSKHVSVQFTTCKDDPKNFIKVIGSVEHAKEEKSKQSYLSSKGSATFMQQITLTQENELAAIQTCMNKVLKQLEEYSFYHA